MSKKGSGSKQAPKKRGSQLQTNRSGWGQWVKKNIALSGIIGAIIAGAAGTVVDNELASDPPSGGTSVCRIDITKHGVHTHEVEVCRSSDQGRIPPSPR